jgi:hypothetical protein
VKNRRVAARSRFYQYRAIDDPAVLIDRPVRIHPPAGDPDVGLIDQPSRVLEPIEVSSTGSTVSYADRAEPSRALGSLWVEHEGEHIQHLVITVGP